MATVTANHLLPGVEDEPGFWSRVGHRLIESRMRQADRAVASYLLSLDDETLAKLGYDRREVERRNPMGYPFI